MTNRRFKLNQLWCLSLCGAVFACTETPPRETDADESSDDPWVYQALGRDELAPHGFTPREAAERFSFTHRAWFEYASGERTRLVWSVQANDQVLEDVYGVLEEGAKYAYIVTDAGGHDWGFGVAFRADLRFSTEDGQLDESLETNVYVPTLEAATLHAARVDEADIQGDLELDDRSRILFYVDMQADNSGVRADGRVRRLPADGTLGTWSSGPDTWQASDAGP
jgi:hypothetical protein